MDGLILALVHDVGKILMEVIFIIKENVHCCNPLLLFENNP